MAEENAKPALDMMNYGMYVIGSRGPLGLNVMAAHWLMQISFKPRMVALSLENDARKQLIEKTPDAPGMP